MSFAGGYRLCFSKKRWFPHRGPDRADAKDGIGGWLRLGCVVPFVPPQSIEYRAGRGVDAGPAPRSRPPRAVSAGACGSGAAEKAMATRPANERTGCGLETTRTNHHQSLTVRSGSQSDQNDRVKKVPSTLFVSHSAIHFGPLYGPLWPSRTGFPSGQARGVHRTAQSRTKWPKLKCRISALWGCRQEPRARITGLSF